MKEILLTQNRVALVDGCDYERLSQFRWHAVASKTKRVFYAARRSSRISGKQYTIWMHHEIIGRPPKGFEVDHRNGNGLWNLRNNLRFVTKRQNQQNRKHQNSSSQYPGVYWNKDRQKWRANIIINGKSKHLGYFEIEKEAFLAYKQAVNELGESIIEGAKI